MSQRNSGYQRKERDCYETPPWVTSVLGPHIPKRITQIWEPACGSGKMLRVFDEWDFRVKATDIATGDDFLESSDNWAGAIITNPPYNLAREFIARALDATEVGVGFVAMLLRTDFDHAKSRQSLFGCCEEFAKKLVLTKRIRWIEGSTGQPSFNHAWFMWDWQHKGPPTLAYA
jgi:hypothetical protein